MDQIMAIYLTAVFYLLAYSGDLTTWAGWVHGVLVGEGAGGGVVGVPVPVHERMLHVSGQHAWKHVYGSVKNEENGDKYGLKMLILYVHCH